MRARLPPWCTPGQHDESMVSWPSDAVKMKKEEVGRGVGVAMEISTRRPWGLQSAGVASSHWHVEGVRFVGSRILSTGEGQHFDGFRGKGASGDDRVKTTGSHSYAMAETIDFERAVMR